MDPVLADRVRKSVAVVAATGLTVLLLRVLARLADGRQRWLDPELLGLVLLGAAGGLWVRAAVRIRTASRRRPPEPGGADSIRTPESPGDDVR